MKLLIAIPVHNERKYVTQVLAKVRSYHDQVLVIDDGSTDGTSPLLAEMAKAGRIHLIRHPVNKGYGQSLIDAFAFAEHGGFDWVVTMDCDEQHEPEMIPEFIKQIESDKWDVISGSRYLRPQNDDDLPPADRRTINTNITAILNQLFNWKLTDAFCGYKAHRVSAMRKLALTETGYAFPLQLWPQVWAADLRVTELPVRLIYNDLARTFGGALNDAGDRLRHYLTVLSQELQAISVRQKPDAEAGTSAAAPTPPSGHLMEKVAARLTSLCGCSA